MEQHYTITVVAKKLSVHRNTVARWLRDGLIKAVRIGGSVRIAASELERLTR